MILSNEQARILKKINENHLKGYKVKTDKFGISIESKHEICPDIANGTLYIPSHIKNQIQFIINRLKL